MADDLIKRLEEATEGSRDLDAEIWWIADNRSAKCAYWNAATGLPRELADKMPTSGLGYLAMTVQAPHYTTSLDAAIPGENVLEVSWSIYGWKAVVLSDNKRFVSTAKTEALARRAAALKAKDQS